MAATIPNCKSYDPAFAAELAVIIDRGIQDMKVEQKDIFYYVTPMNENHAQPALHSGSETGILQGCYLFDSYPRTPGKRCSPEMLKDSAEVTLPGSGTPGTDGVGRSDTRAALRQFFGVDAQSIANAAPQQLKNG